MWYTVKEDASYGFDLQRGFLADSPIIEENFCYVVLPT